MPGIDDFMEALSSNKELAEQLTDASTPDEAMKIATDKSHYHFFRVLAKLFQHACAYA